MESLDRRRAAPGPDHGRWGLPLYFLLVVGAFAVAAAAAAAYVFMQTDRDSRAAARSDARFAATTAARQLGGGVASLKATVAQLAAKPGIEQASTQPSCALTFTLGDVSRGHVDVLRPDGTVACSSRPRSDGRPLAGYRGAAWPARVGSSPVLLAPVRDAATGDRSLLAAARTSKGWIVAAFAALEPIGPSLASVYG